MWRVTAKNLHSTQTAAPAPPLPRPVALTELDGRQHDASSAPVVRVSEAMPWNPATRLFRQPQASIMT
eukprot:364846-Chlamydomonas_euryale.AAC.6